MNWKDKAKKLFDQGVKMSKKAVEETVELGQIGQLKVEIKLSEGKINKKFSELGKYIQTYFEEENATSLSSDNVKVVEILEEVKKLEEEIQNKEKEIKKLKEEKNEEEDKEEQPSPSTLTEE